MSSKSLIVLSGLLLVLGCIAPEEAGQGPGKTPISVRGWIADIQLPPQEIMKVSDPAKERQRMYQFLRDTNVYVVDMPFVSGAIAETGAFILLDVPPGDVTVRFQPPGLPEAELVLTNLPGNADVLIPALRIDGEKVSLQDPSLAVARIPIDEERRTQLDRVVTVGGDPIEVWEVPFSDLVDRREFPTGDEVHPSEVGKQ